MYERLSSIGERLLPFSLLVQDVALLYVPSASTYTDTETR